MIRGWMLQPPVLTVTVAALIATESARAVLNAGVGTARW